MPNVKASSQSAFRVACRAGVASRSVEETGSVAREFAKRLRPTRGRATIVALSGELGVGKTFFVQILLRALGVRQQIQSPTFVLMRRYALQGSSFRNAYHIDAYRVRDARGEARRLGLKEIFADQDALVLVEWSERLGGVLPRDVVGVKMRHGGQEGERMIRIMTGH